MDDELMKIANEALDGLWADYDLWPGNGMPELVETTVHVVEFPPDVAADEDRMHNMLDELAILYGDAP